MSDDLNEENVEKAAKLLHTKLTLQRIIDGTDRQHIRPLAPPKQMPPHMRPHTYIFLRGQPGDEEPVVCLGVTFHTWAMNKFNMVRFTARAPAGGKDVTTSGRLVTLENGAYGLILDVRWPWETMLSKYKGLSAGNL